MKNINKTIKNLPDKSGIYLFYDNKDVLVYVGKATSLKNRVKSYFQGQKSPRPIEEMIEEVEKIKHLETDSVLEAVVLEAIYIKKYQPKYNVKGKDDKSWQFIVITKDEYPKVETVRQRNLSQIDEKEKNKRFLKIFGPYPGLNAKETLKILRKIFHFSTCKPNQGRECLYRQIGLCEGVCVGKITPKEYRQKVIHPLILFLFGKKKRLIKDLEIKMKKKAKEQKYEEAGKIRDQIFYLENIQDIALLNRGFVENIDFEKENFISKIEGYDISNLGASGKVGSMIVFVNGEPDKEQYRKFKIKTVRGQSDVDCLGEVILRRVKRFEWPLPDLFLIDGGKPQVNRVKKILEENYIDIPIVGIAKGPERKKNEFIHSLKDKKTLDWLNENANVLINARDEAHRFAIKYQKSLRKIV